MRRSSTGHTGPSVRLLLVAVLVLLGTGCWDFTGIRMFVQWDADDGVIHLTEELRDLRADDIGECHEDATRCADFLEGALKEGNVLDLEAEVTVLEERLRVRDGALDLIVRFDVPDRSASAREMGFVVEEQGRVGREKAFLVYTTGTWFPLVPLDPPRKLAHRRTHGEETVDSWVVDRRLKQVLFGADSEDAPETPSLLEAMPELEGLLRERGLLSGSR